MTAAAPAPHADKPPADRAARASAAGKASAEKRAAKVAQEAAAKSQHDAHIVRTLTGYHGIAGLFIGRGPDKYDGAVWMIQAKPASEAWVAVGHEHPEVMRVLEVITSAGPVVTLITAYAGAIVAMMAHHGAVPVEAVDLFGLPRPDQVVARAGGSPFRRSPSGRPGPPGAPPPDTGTVQPPAGEPLAPQFSPELGAQAAAEGELPHDVEIAARELSRTQGIPYEQVRAAALAQMRDYQATLGGEPGRPPTYLGEVVTP